MFMRCTRLRISTNKLSINKLNRLIVYKVYVIPTSSISWYQVVSQKVLRHTCEDA